MDEIGSYGKFSTSMKLIDYSDYCGGYISPNPPGFALMLIEFLKDIGKSLDKFYPTDQKTSSILVLTLLKAL